MIVTYVPAKGRRVPGLTKSLNLTTGVGIDLYNNMICHSGSLSSIAWFLEIAFVHEVGVCVCVSVSESINYIHMIFNLYNQLNKFVMFRNITKQFFVWAWPL